MNYFRKIREGFHSNKLSGKLPDKRLEEISNTKRLVKFKICVGIVPDNWLELRYNTYSFVIYAICVGIVPDN
jgi:hypothetical protein